MAKKAQSKKTISTKTQDQEIETYKVDTPVDYSNWPMPCIVEKKNKKKK